MTQTIIVGLLSFAGVLISNYFTHSKTMYRIDQLEKKQDKHNEVIERTYKIETDVEVIQNDISNIKDDIKELKR